MLAAWIAASIIAPGTAVAGGSWLEPSWERVEPGDQIGMAGDVFHGQLGWIEDGPYFAYLNGDNYGTVLDEGFGGAQTDVPLGELEVKDRGNWAQVSVSFTLPNDIPPGEYLVGVCNEPCTIGFGDLIGAVLYVGMDPPADTEIVPVAASTTTIPVATTNGIAATAPAIKQSSSPRLMLTAQPDRSTNFSPLWVVLSAGLAAAALGATLFIRGSGRS